MNKILGPFDPPAGDRLNIRPRFFSLRRRRRHLIELVVTSDPQSSFLSLGFPLPFFQGPGCILFLIPLSFPCSATILQRDMYKQKGGGSSRYIQVCGYGIAIFLQDLCHAAADDDMSNLLA